MPGACRAFSKGEIDHYLDTVFLRFVRVASSSINLFTRVKYINLKEPCNETEDSIKIASEILGSGFIYDSICY